MLQLRFFASIRERVGVSGISHAFDPDCTNIVSLVGALDAGVLPGCAHWLLAENTIVAVNRVVVARTQTLRDGDEVAFYPPVTGG